MQTLIHRWQEKAGVKAETAHLCRVLGVSRSGVYAARVRDQARRPCAVTMALRSTFAASGGSYGSRRLTASLKAQGHTVGRYRVRSLMRKSAIRACWKRKFVHTTNSRHDLPVADNLLNRQFRPDAPNQAWVADITYVRTATGWLYLAGVLDLYSRKVVGWATSESMPAELVCNALNMAITLRKPKPGLLVHTDRGSQYASGAHRQILAQHGLVASMSRKGNCHDNAVMERFFLNLKMERLWQHRYDNPMQAAADINQYIVGFYNTRRLHSTLGYRSPNDFEKFNH